MIGLKRGTVKLSEFSDDWSSLFDHEKQKILGLIGEGELTIEHVGSTSVPGLKAKPIIDIAIEVSSMDRLNELVEPLVNAGYTYFGEREIKGDFCFMNGPEECRTHKIHVSIQGSNRLSDFTRFRDSLRNSSILRKEYESLKIQLSKKHSNDGASYTQGKSDLINRIINE